MNRFALANLYVPVDDLLYECKKNENELYVSVVLGLIVGKCERRGMFYILYLFAQNTLQY